MVRARQCLVILDRRYISFRSWPLENIRSAIVNWLSSVTLRPVVCVSHSNITSRSGILLVAAVTRKACFSLAGERISACLLSGRLGMFLSLNNVPDSGSFLRELVLRLPNIITLLKADVHGKLFVTRSSPGFEPELNRCICKNSDAHQYLNCSSEIVSPPAE